jgi:orotidine-5'-phosphate decarboxylase
MMESAASSAPEGTDVLGVTILTSLDEASVAEVGWPNGIPAAVDRLSALARKAGLGGVVCSPHEATQERVAWGKLAEVITPGVRPPGGNQNDQARAKTALEAIVAGASRIVIGRPVLNAADPEGALEFILEGKG